MKKRVFLVVLATVAALTLCACGAGGEGGSGGSGGAAKASFTPQTHRVAAGSSACAVLLDDGTVSCSLDTSADQYIQVNDEWKAWTDVVDISLNEEILAAVKADGTVVWCGGRTKEYDWLSDPAYMDVVDSWKNVVQVSASNWDIAALKADGSVEITGSIWTEDLAEKSGFTQVSVYDALLCLREDGTVFCHAPHKYDGQKWSYDVSGWSGITQVSAGWDHAVGLKSDGTVVATGNNDCGQCKVSKWTDIVQVQAGRGFTMGLKSDGTVVICGDPNGDKTQLKVGGWKGIQEIGGFFDEAIGLKADGSVVYTAVYDRGNPAAKSTKVG